jgi:hypothetical protein
MLNMNRYMDTGLFRHGFGLSLLSFALGKFNNGAYRIDFNGPTVQSPSTGHWPLRLLSFTAVTGALAGWQASVLGFTFGSQLMPNVDDEGKLLGPDVRKSYFFFSCLNHQDQTLEEIINAK